MRIPPRMVAVETMWSMRAEINWKKKMKWEKVMKLKNFFYPIINPLRPNKTLDRCDMRFLDALSPVFL